MSESQPTFPGFSFNRSLRLSGADQRLSSCGGVLVLRELDERLGLFAKLSRQLKDPRRSTHVTWSVCEQLRARVFALAAGFSAQHDVALLERDPVCRLARSDRRGTSPAFDSGDISQPTLARFHRLLAAQDNLAALERSLFDLGVALIRQAAGMRKVKHTIDVDSMPVMSHGQQPGSVWNGHYRGRCFHPLMALHGESGTLLGAKLRAGNSSSAKGAKDFLLSLLAGFERAVGPVAKVRGDSSFVSGALLDALEERGTQYVFCFGLNKRLKALAAPYLDVEAVPAGGEPKEWLYSLEYEGARWKKLRRVILVVQATPGELYPHYFFLITNDRRSSPKTILEHYRQRGTAESRFGELKSRLAPKLSCTSRKGEPARDEAWRANEGTFQLYLLADGLLHGLRWLARKEISTDGSSLPRLQRVQRLLVDVAARLTLGARRVHVHLEERTRELWLALLARIGRLRPVT